MRISTCIITKGDNLESLQTAVNSVLSSSFEIIIGANNNSYENVKELFKEIPKVKVFDQVWENDFSKARNETIDLATGDFILIIDSDDILQTEIKYLTNKYDFWLVNIKHNVEENIGRKYLDDISIRLFRNDPEIRYDNKIHETVETRIKPGHKICRSEILIEHNGYNSSVDLKEKLERNQSILLTDENNNIKEYLFMRHYWKLGESEKSYDYARQVIGGNYNPEMKAVACLFLGFISLNKFNDVDACMQYLVMSLALIPKQIQARYLLIQCLIAKSDMTAKKIVTSQLQAIESLTSTDGSLLPNDIYINETIINKIKGEIAKWQ